MTPHLTPPSRRQRLAGYAFSAAVVLTILSAGVVFPLLSPAQGKAYPDIVALEFAGWNPAYVRDSSGNDLVSPDSALGIVKRWTADGGPNVSRLQLARNDVRFDFFFIVCYSTVFSFGVRLAATAFAVGGGGLSRWLARGQLLAGLCDGIENVFLLRMLADGAEDAALVADGKIMTAFVAAKFILLLAGAIYLIVAACEPLRRRVERL